MTQSEIVKKIIHLEEKYNFFPESSAKINKWPFYRVYFFKKICVELGITQDIKNSNNRKIININTLLSLLKNINLHVFFHGECEDLFFCSQRIDTNNNEIYCSEFIKKSSSYKIISQTQNFKFIQGFYYLDFWKSVFTAISVVWSRIFSLKEDEVFMNLCHDLGLDSHQQKKMVRHMRQYYFIYDLWHLFYKNVLKRIKPKKIYLVGGIFYAPLVNVADAMNIDTIEIQHGVINKNHLGYHFPKTSRDGYFSRELYLLSNFWKEKASLPAGVKTTQTGNNYFYRQPTVSNKKNDVLFVSGPRYGDKVAEIAISFAEKNKGVPISFKLHPREAKDWKKRYKKLYELHQRQLIEIMTGISSSEKLQSFEYIISTSSTMAYELIDMRKKVFIINFHDDYFTEEVELGYCKYFENKHFCIDQMQKEDFNLPDFKFFSKFSFPNKDE